jgi:hypothetical protein
MPATHDEYAEWEIPANFHVPEPYIPMVKVLLEIPAEIGLQLKSDYILGYEDQWKSQTSILEKFHNVSPSAGPKRYVAFRYWSTSEKVNFPNIN